MSNSGIPARLRQARTVLGLSQNAIADKAGIARATYPKYESGVSVPGGDALAGLIRSGIHSDWILTGDGPMLLKDRVPHYTGTESDADAARGQIAIQNGEPDKHGQIASVRSAYVAVPWVSAAAGCGIDNEGSAIERPYLNEQWVRRIIGIPPQRLALATVDGSSMEPTLLHGEVVCVDVGVTQFRSDAVYLISIGGLERIKRLQLLASGHVLIKSDNAQIEPERMTLDEAQQIHVIGMVLPVKLGFFKL